MDKRYLTLDVYDYSGNKKVNLYDSTKQMSGEAVDIKKTEERNGWKELSFTLPTTCSGENGEEENYRLQFLIADYMIRFDDGKEVDWYIISEHTVQHNNFSKNVSVVAGHIAQLLKTKNMNLEFSDTEGNNVGTARELATAALKGTDWHVGYVPEFYESYDNTIVKKRTLTASAQTGAFKLIEMICELFDAKPVYHAEWTLDEDDSTEISGDGDYEILDNESKKYHVVDIVPMNPFSVKTMVDGIPYEALTGNNKVLELHYNRNLKNMSRKLDTSSMITKLYAYGSYGDLNGLCSIQTCEHDVYVFTISLPDPEEGEEEPTIPKGSELFFKDSYGAYYYFKNNRPLKNGNKLSWSRLDFMSRSYIWDIKGQIAYKLYKSPRTDSWSDLETYSTLNILRKQNLFPYLLNFNYYDEVGLLDNAKFQQIAKLQRTTPELYEECMEKATEFADRLTDISDLGKPTTGFARLHVGRYYRSNQNDTSPGPKNIAGREVYMMLSTNKGDRGVMYRSDYMNNRKNQFAWHVAEELKPNGRPVTGTPSYVLIVHDNEHEELDEDGQIIVCKDHVTWSKSWIKEIWVVSKDNPMPHKLVDSEGNAKDYYPALEDEDTYPVGLLLWAPISTDGRDRRIRDYRTTDQFFLFCTDSQAGKIAGIESQAEAIIESKIKTSLGQEPETHPVYFMCGDEDESGPIDSIPTTSVVSIDGQYGWYYKYFRGVNKDGDVFFCGPNDTTWHKMTIAEAEPSNPTLGDYLFNSVERVIYVYCTETSEDGTVSNVWHELESSDDKRIAQATSQVLYYCHRYDELYRGLYAYYYHRVDGQEEGDIDTDSSGNPIYRGYLPTGRYAIDSGFDYYWTFQTTQKIYPDTIIKLDTQRKYIYQDDDTSNIVTACVQPKYNTQEMSSNLLGGWKKKFSKGTIDRTTGLEKSIENVAYTPYRSSYVKVYPGKRYDLTMPEAEQYNNKYQGFVFFYDANKYYISSIAINQHGKNITKDGGYFTTPKANGINPESADYHPDAEYVRIVWTNLYGNSGVTPNLHIHNYQKKIYLNDNTNTVYTLLSKTKRSTIPDASTEQLGLYNLMARFVNAANYAYNVILGPLQDLQQEIKDLDTETAELLGPLLREGYWKDDSYVEGDEEKLYYDAMDNLEEVGKPEASYEISFIDQYGSNEGLGYSVDGSTEYVPYHDIEISNAVHLVDPAIGVNCWGYLDKVTICYDKPWETAIEVNTRLSLIGQHEFTDVLTTIADVAKSSKNKQTVYDAAVEACGIDVDELRNLVYTLQEYQGQALNGGITNWYYYNGDEIFGSNPRGVYPEGLNWGGNVLDEQSTGSINIDGSPVQTAVVHDANVIGCILSGVDFSGAMGTGLTVQDTIAQRVKQEMEKIFKTENVRFANSRSHWYTDDDTGALVFEEVDLSGNPTGQAFCIGGTGIMRSESWNEDGQYDWTPVMTSSGITADSITTGKLKSALIEGSSISANQLMADAGQLLDISSNVGLDLYATTNGEKPSGALKTTDALIEIHSKITDETVSEELRPLPPDKICDHARIKIASGGEINLEAGPDVETYEHLTDIVDPQPTKLYYISSEDKYYIWDVSKNRFKGSTDVGGINIEASRYINIGSKGTLNLLSEGQMLIEGGAGLTVQSEGAINILSGAQQGIEGELNIMSTGSLNIRANGIMNILADGLLRVHSGGGVEIASNGAINISTNGHGNVDGDLNIRSQGTLNLESEGKLNVRSNSEVIVQSQGIVSMLAGSAMNIGVGSSTDDPNANTNLDAELNIKSQGALNIFADGCLKLRSFIDDDHTGIDAHGYVWDDVFIDDKLVIETGETTDIDKTVAYQAAITEFTNDIQRWYNGSGKTANDDAKAARAMAQAKSSLRHVFYVEGDNKQHTGGKISIESEDGIEINSGGSIRVGAGAKGEIDGILELRSQGELLVGSNSSIRIAAGSTGLKDEPGNDIEPIPGRIIVESTGSIEMNAGSEFNVYGGSITLNSDTTLYASSNNFVIDNTGVHVNGEITAKSGHIGGFNITSTSASNIKPLDGGHYFAHSLYTYVEDEYSGYESGFKGVGEGDAVFYVLKQSIKNTAWDSATKQYMFQVTRYGKLIAADVQITGGSLNINNGRFKVTQDGALNIGAGKFVVTPEGKATASDITVTGGSLNIGGKFIVYTNGALTIGNAFSVTAEGKLTASNVDITGGTLKIGSNFDVSNTGELTASNVNITSGKLKIGSAFEVTNVGKLTASDVDITGGKLKIGTAFEVTAAGKLTASNVDITGGSLTIGSAFSVSPTGEITSTSGSIGGWNINANSLFIEKTVSTGGFPAYENYQIVLNADLTTRSSKVIEFSSTPTNDSSTVSSWFSVTAHGDVKCNTVDGGTIECHSGLKVGQEDISTHYPYGLEYNSGYLSIGHFSTECHHTDSTGAYCTSIDGTSTVTISGQTEPTTFGATFRSPSTSVSDATTTTAHSGIILSIGTGSDIGNRNFRVNRYGTLHAVGTITSSSSLFVKHDIKSLANLSVFDKLNPVSFKYNNDESDKTHYGLIYEETIKLIPDVCQENNGTKTINYIELVPILIKEIQNLRTRVSELEKG